MACVSKHLLFLLRRGVAVGQVTLRTCITTGGRSGFIQKRAWTSTNGAACLQRLCQPLSAVKISQYSFSTEEGNEYPPLPAYQCETEKDNMEVHLVQVKGIPWSCKAENLLHFFSDCKVKDGLKGIHIIVNMNGKPLGQALVEMEGREDIDKALEKHGQYLGPRYLEVYEMTNDDAEAMLQNSTQTLTEDGMVRLRGLPFVCTEADIAKFFSGLDIVENGITFTLYSKGRNTGEAFVQFSSQEAANEALKRDRAFMGERYIEVFPHRRDRIIATEKTHPSTEAPQSSAPQHFAPESSTPQSFDLQSFDPQSSTPQSFDLQSFDPQSSTPQHFPPQSSAPQSFDPQSFDPQSSTPQSFDPQSSTPQSFDPQSSTPQSFAPQSSAPQRSAPQSSASQSSAPQRFAPQRTAPQRFAPQRFAPQSSAPQRFAPHVHFIHMRGIPYWASGEDITKFFFPLVVSKIVLECHPNGRLNGEADVYFRFAQDATSAMSKDGKHIGNRYIELFLNSGVPL